jgi:hypothetical protein
MHEYGHILNGDDETSEHSPNVHSIMYKWIYDTSALYQEITDEDRAKARKAQRDAPVRLHCVKNEEGLYECQ